MKQIWKYQNQIKYWRKKDRRFRNDESKTFIIIKSNKKLEKKW